MRLWHAMLDSALPAAAQGSKPRAAAPAPEPDGEAEQSPGPVLDRETELARILGNFSCANPRKPACTLLARIAQAVGLGRYVMLAQLGIPVQAVVAFTASVCDERKVSKEAKFATLAVLDELAKDLAAPEPSSRRERSASDAKVTRHRHAYARTTGCAESRLAEEKGREC